MTAAQKIWAKQRRIKKMRLKKMTVAKKIGAKQLKKNGTLWKWLCQKKSEPNSVG